jgi:hypothetical protein
MGVLYDTEIQRNVFAAFCASEDDPMQVVIWISVAGSLLAALPRNKYQRLPTGFGLVMPALAAVSALARGVSHGVTA